MGLYNQVKTATGALFGGIKDGVLYTFTTLVMAIAGNSLYELIKAYFIGDSSSGAFIWKLWGILIVSGLVFLILVLKILLRLRKPVFRPDTQQEQAYILNFAHPLKEVVKEQISASMGWNKTAMDVRIVECFLNIQPDDDVNEKVLEGLKNVDIPIEHWQTSAFVVIPPGMSAANGSVFAAVFGLTGGFPSVARVLKNPEGLFNEVKLIHLDHIKRESRLLRPGLRL